MKHHLCDPSWLTIVPFFVFPLSSLAFHRNQVLHRTPLGNRIAFLSSSREIEFQQRPQHCQDDDNTNHRRRFQLENQVSKSSKWDDDAFEVVRHFTETAIQHRGQPKSIQALQVLSARCQERQPFGFETHDETEPREISGPVISKISNLLPSHVTRAFLEQVQTMEYNGWLSTNPDSVDGLPSLHINLMSGGKSVIPKEKEEETDLNDLERGIVQLQAMIEPYIQDRLLPEVNRLLNSTSIQVSDLFLRRYGQDIGGDGDGTLSRNSLSAHYDVLSRVTAVIALDNVAALGTNGLYTTYQSPPPLSNNNKLGTTSTGKTSNHASLRRFFPLARGDAAVHTWDVLHGVDVEPGLERTSLIVWFTTAEEQRQQEQPDKSNTVGCWLTDPTKLEEDDVAQFVLATALSSSPASNDDDYQHLLAEKQHRLYLQSAAQGNAFALNSIGCICEEGNLSSEMVKESLKVLESLRPLTMLPHPIRCYCGDDDVDNSRQLLLLEMARRFWFEGSVRGNPLAQQALADSLMLHESTLSSLAGGNSVSHSAEKQAEDSRLLAAVLFALASQQGKEDALESLSRVVEIDLSTRTIQSEEDFLASPVVQIAQAI
jgi:hypothetical protein